MDSITHVSRSSRIARAKLGLHLGGLTLNIIVSLGVLLLASGVGLLLLGNAIGWSLAGISVISYMLYVWYRNDLRDVPVSSGSAIEDVLESAVLARLPANASPKQIAEAAMGATSGQFFAGRFGISPSFLADLSSTDPADSVAVWQRAKQLAGSSSVARIDGAMLVGALIGTQTRLISLLPHLQLDETDIELGVRWYRRLRELIDHQKIARRTGGIARDWSFGYTPTLERFGQNISSMVSHGGLLHIRLEAHQPALHYLFETFGSGGRQNVALVGPAGVGKQAIIQAFAEELLSADSRLPESLKFRQIVSLDASALISAARTRSELESLVNHLLVEAFKAKNIILCLEDASLFLEEGPGSVDISSILSPVLEGGRLRMILTMNEQSWLRIAQRRPALVSALNRVAVGEPNERETMMVMQDQLIAIEFSRKVTFMYQALKEAYRLSQRYLHDQAQPGKSIQLLELAAGQAENGVVTVGSVQRAVESSNGVKVDSAIGSQDEKDKLLKLEELIHQRMINQTRAVSVVSDAIRRARAGVRNPSRPIGTFLFLGPTGVGKSELAKSLAAVYFGGEDKLVRLDLNEFVRSDDVLRLIADGAQDPHSLTASILKQPFSVVLLDEIEKAHPHVLNALLQLLDEGVLRDVNNREVSFRDAIIIATSNAGASRIRQYIDAGYQLEQFETQLVNELIDSDQFRPEFLNRFDEIVVFRPLNEEELAQVVGLIIDGINKTMSHQKIRVELSDSAKRKLASIGYDPRLGARPMRRVVQRSVESLIAKRMLEGSAGPGSTVEITEDDIRS